MDVSYAQTEEPAIRRRRFIVPFVLLAALLSALGLATTTPVVSAWYTDAPRIEWSPQIWAFTTAWTVIYILVAIAGWSLARRAERHWRGPLAMRLYWSHVVLQAAWLLGFMAQSLVSGEWLWAVFASIAVLDIVTLLAAVTAWTVSRTSSVLMLVVLAWLLFGTALSGADTLLQVGVL